MKKAKHSIFISLLTLTFACGGGNSEKSDIVKKDSIETVTEDKKEAKEDKPKADVAEEVLEGTFLGIEQGDYAYFKVKAANGDEKSLMVLDTDETYQKIEAAPDKFVGKKVKVYWTKSKENIPENGGEMEVEKYLRAEVLN
jgi:hypothetical protein